MATDNSYTEPAAKWISDLAMCIINTLLIGALLHSEFKKRRESSTSFTTKWFKLFSISCIICCFSAAMCGMLSYIPIFCTFSLFLNYLLGFYAVTFMGFYQLSRLYYCFANAQIHSDKGYPKCLFIFMFIIGILLPINLMLSYLLTNQVVLLRSKCGYNDFKFYYYPITDIPSHESAGIWYTFIYMIYVFWDVFTLYLYLRKIRAFKKYENTEPIVYKRIMSILYKVTILTLLYQIVNLFSFILGIGAWFLNNDVINSIVLTFNAQINAYIYALSMYLMMEHNRKHYVKFLRIIYYSKMYWILCCCCKYIVIEQSGEFMKDFVDVVDDKNIAKGIEETKSTEISDEHGDNKTNNNGMELSEETIATVVVANDK